MTRTSIQFAVTDLTQADCTVISELHKQELPNDFCSLLGEKFMRETFYPELLKSENTFGLCVRSSKKIIAFVIFSANLDFLKNLVRKKTKKITYACLPNILNLKFIRYVLEVFILVFFKKPFPFFTAYELTYIAIDRQFQGIGLGSLLVKSGLQVLKNMGHEICWVKTLENTPETIRFYEKNNFNLSNRSFGRAYLVHTTDSNC